MKFTKTENRNTWYKPACLMSKTLLRLFNRVALKQKEIDALVEAGFVVVIVE